MSYKSNANSNRDALFGSSGGSSKSKRPSGAGPKHKRDAAANRDALFGSAGSSSKPSGKPKTRRKDSGSDSASARSSRSETTASSAADSRPSRGYVPSTSNTSDTGTRKGRVTSVLSGTAKVEKLKEAEEYREKAKQCMKRGVFSRPDPLAAGMYYKRAADAYKQCGENRLERLHRIASGDSQMGQGAYATAAAEYTRAADLVKESEETTARKRKEGWKLHSDAAEAWRQMGESGKAADSMVKSGLALLWEDDSTLMDKEALEALEKAVEAHVPDPLNRYARYRQTGISAFLDPNDDSGKPSSEAMMLAKDMMVKKAYAHEPLQQMVYVFSRYGEYASAIYASGAASAILESSGLATITLARSYIMETILLLALGDPVAARQYFLEVHVQNTTYLQSRECKLAEDLFTAVLARDKDGLEEARSPSGSNRACLAHLDESLRTLVAQLRVSGVARRQVGSTTSKSKQRTAIDDELDRELNFPVKAAAAAPKQNVAEEDSSSEEEPEPQEEEDSSDESDDEEIAEGMQGDALQAELDALGLSSEDEDDDDSDLDLR